MTQITRLAFALICFTVLIGCDIEDVVHAARYKSQFTETKTLTPGGRLSVENFNGSIEINGWERDQVEIDATLYASSEELLSALKVDVVATDGFVQVRTVRPSGRRGNMGASYVIHVPHRVLLDRILSSNGVVTVNEIEGDARIRTSNGRVRLDSIDGNMEVETSNGAVEISNSSGSADLNTSNGAIKLDSVRGHLKARTSNGSINAKLAPDNSRPTTLRSSNGGIELTLTGAPGNDITATTSNSNIEIRAPESLAARLEADTSNGSIKSDFQVDGTVKKKHVEGSINGGGPLLKLDTSNGSIRLLRHNSEL